MQPEHARIVSGAALDDDLRMDATVRPSGSASTSGNSA